MIIRIMTPETSASDRSSSLLLVGLWFEDVISHLTSTFSFGLVSGCLLALTYLLDLKPGLFTRKTFLYPGKEIFWTEFKTYLA